MRNTRMGTPAARVAALITAGALAAGVGAASASAGASPHARATTEVRAFAASPLTSSTLDLTTNTWYTCVGPCATATYFTDYGVARSGLTVFGFSGTGTEVSFLKYGCSISSDHFALTEQSRRAQGGHDLVFNHVGQILPYEEPQSVQRDRIDHHCGGHRGIQERDWDGVHYLDSPRSAADRLRHDRGVNNLLNQRNSSQAGYCA